MIRYVMALLLISFFPCRGSAQFDSSYVRTQLRRCADSLTDSFKKKDWDKYTRYSYPAMVAGFGGKAEFSRYMEEQFNRFPDSAWKKYAAGNILQLVKNGQDLQAVVELQTVAEWQGMRVTSTSYLVGESWDGGRFWTFFNSQGDLAKARAINHNLSKDLKIPAKTEHLDPVIPPDGSGNPPR